MIARTRAAPRRASCLSVHERRPLIWGGVALVTLLLAAGCRPQPVPANASTFTLLPVATGFASPVALAAPNDGSGRLFIVDQTGVVSVVNAAGQILTTPLLDLRAQVVAADERGLLGLALHPQFVDNGRLFVYYNTPPSADAPAGYAAEVRLSEFLIAAGLPNQVSPATERVLLRVAKPQTNHNGGQLAFGSDGFLYVGLGDGGGSGDTGFGHTPNLGNAQDTTVLLGKILRIDVDHGDPYAIPPDNPFANSTTARPEIYAYGFRNPWRFSFDVAPPSPSRLFVGDVGQNLMEEVDLVARGGNYGWNLMEGTLCFNPQTPLTPPASCSDHGADGSVLQPPIIAYLHTDANGTPFGSAVIGGFLYRGAAVPNLRGGYVFGDFAAGPVTGKIFVGNEATSGTWSFKEAQVAETPTGRLDRFVLAFGRDAAGELYVLSNATGTPSGTSGAVHKIVGFD